MEIERKYLVPVLPKDLSRYDCLHIEQAYLCIAPVVRIRRQDESYFLTYKSSGFMVREEYNLPLDQASYEHLKEKIDGNLIAKKRYLIPLDNHLKAELDIFLAPFEGLRIVEVEFTTEAEALSFVPPAWFGAEVTFSEKYHNSFLSQADPKDLDRN